MPFFEVKDMPSSFLSRLSYRHMTCCSAKEKVASSFAHRAFFFFFFFFCKIPCKCFFFFFWFRAHEHWNLPEAPDIVTFAKKMQIAGYYMTTKRETTWTSMWLASSHHSQLIYTSQIDGVFFLFLEMQFPSSFFFFFCLICPISLRGSSLFPNT